MTQESTSGLVGFRELHRRFGAGRNERAFRVWLWRETRAGRFPAPKMISPYRRAWRSDAIDAWEQALKDVGYAPAQNAPTAPTHSPEVA